MALALLLSKGRMAKVADGSGSAAKQGMAKVADGSGSAAKQGKDGNELLHHFVWLRPSFQDW